MFLSVDHPVLYSDAATAAMMRLSLGQGQKSQSKIGKDWQKNALESAQLEIIGEKQSKEVKMTSLRAYMHKNICITNKWKLKTNNLNPTPM